jgi:hypothetical protein
MIRKGLKPGFRIGIASPAEQNEFRQVLPFRRSWVAIVILAVMDAAFLVPTVLTFQQAMGEWGNLDSLIDLVAAAFLSAWLLGWVIAPLIMTTILVLLLFGREVLKAGPGWLELFVGVPFIGISSRYDVAKMRNLRFEQAPKKSGKSWRGDHLAFDYGANTIAFGSNIDARELTKLKQQLEVATGETIRHGDAEPGEVEAKWKSDDIEARQQTNEIESPHFAATVSQVDSAPISLTSASTLMLIIANLIPVAGSVFLGWNLADVMVLYWAESAVIGFFNICKIIVIGRWAALFAAPFFAGHFGGFMAVHFLFIYTIFIEGAQSGAAADGQLAEVASLFNRLWPALLALFISHAFSFHTNFLGRKAYQGKTVKDQMSEPYSRIIFMQMILIFGGGLTMALGSPVPVLVIAIALKIFFDVKAHLKQHADPKIETGK